MQLQTKKRSLELQFRIWRACSNNHKLFICYFYSKICSYLVIISNMLLCQSQARHNFLYVVGAALKMSADANYAVLRPVCCSTTYVVATNQDTFGLQLEPHSGPETVQSDTSQGYQETNPMTYLCMEHKNFKLCRFDFF